MTPIQFATGNTGIWRQCHSSAEMCSRGKMAAIWILSSALRHFQWCAKTTETTSQTARLLRLCKPAERRRRRRTGLAGIWLSGRRRLLLSRAKLQISDAYVQTLAMNQTGQFVVLLVSWRPTLWQPSISSLLFSLWKNVCWSFLTDSSNNYFPD